MKPSSLARIVCTLTLTAASPETSASVTWWNDNNTVHLTGDFNGDSKTDILAWQDNGYVWEFWSKGDGTFPIRDSGLQGTTWWKDNTAHLTGDFNGDGKTDILTWQSDGNVHQYFSNGDGKFTHVAGGLGGLGWWRGNIFHLTGDFNGDGKTDILSWQSDGNVNLFISNGDGTFRRTYQPAGIGAQGWWQGNTAMPTGDFNRDGKTDLLVWGTDGYSALYLSKADGSGTFSKITGVLANAGWWKDNSVFLAGDFNGDGCTDLLNWQTDCYVNVYLSNGNGTFAHTAQPAGAGGIRWWKDNTVHLLGDYDVDGKTDILKWQADGNVHLLLSKGDGTFTTSYLPSGIGAARWWNDTNTAFLTGHFNLDASTDVLTWQSDGLANLYLSKGDGTFAHTAQPSDF
jgi:hypothetical protein